jgi:DNA-binding NarL/FixJ family response regulator
LILLDIGLLSLDGLRTANLIRKVAPDAGIIFLPQSSDKQMIWAASGIGARGYVLKAKAGKELLLAIDAALRNGSDLLRAL